MSEAHSLQRKQREQFNQTAPFYNSRIAFYDSAHKLNFTREKEKKLLV
jgi:hypothetical protein